MNSTEYLKAYTDTGTFKNEDIYSFLVRKNPNKRV